MQRIIFDHKGNIWAESDGRTGTTFFIDLPASGGTRVSTILIIDDEPGIRTVLRDVLEDEGYTVLAAEDGIAGLAELSDGGRGPRLPRRVAPPHGRHRRAGEAPRGASRTSG